MRSQSPFRYFKTWPEVIRLTVMMYVSFPLSLRIVEDLLHERGIDVSHEMSVVRMNGTAGAAIEGRLWLIGVDVKRLGGDGPSGVVGWSGL